MFTPADCSCGTGFLPPSWLYDYKRKKTTTWTSTFNRRDKCQGRRLLPLWMSWMSKQNNRGVLQHERGAIRTMTTATGRAMQQEDYDYMMDDWEEKMENCKRAGPGSSPAWRIWPTPFTLSNLLFKYLKWEKYMFDLIEIFVIYISVTDIVSVHNFSFKLCSRLKKWVQDIQKQKLNLYHGAQMWNHSARVLYLDI